MPRSSLQKAGYRVAGIALLVSEEQPVIRGSGWEGSSS
jgi:hypothetical protein